MPLEPDPARFTLKVRDPGAFVTPNKNVVDIWDQDTLATVASNPPFPEEIPSLPHDKHSQD